MPAVYSERFLMRGGTAGTAEYVVPAGRRAVVKYMMAQNFATTPGAASLVLANVTVWYVPLPGQNQAQKDSLMIVAYAGEILSVGTSGTNVSVAAFGFLLTA